MKKYNYYLLTSLCVISIFSCQKDIPIEQNVESYNRSRTFSEYHYPSNDKDVKTKLGKVKQNPYSVANLIIAMNNLCGDTTGKGIKETDKQVKFSPKDFEQLRALFADTSMTVMEFNLNTEVLVMGNYYHQYQKDGAMPELYSIVPIDAELDKSTPHEVIETYAYDVDDPILLAESFRLTGNTDLIYDYIEFSEATMDSLDICVSVIPPKPTEKCPCADYILYPQVVSTTGIKYNWKCPCDDPAIPNCVDPCYLVYEGTNYDVVPPVEVWDCECPLLPPGNDGIAGLNDCGCPTFGYERKPAGCVNVENTNTNDFEGVESIKVRAYKKYLPPKSTYTDNNGCWRINHNFFGTVHVSVIFKNDDNIIRSGFFEPVAILDYVGSANGPDYRHFEVNYENPGLDVVGTQQQEHWGAATINNELRDFKQNTNDIGEIPFRLDIVTMPNVTNGSAPMGANVVPFNLEPDLIIGLLQVDTEDMQRLLFHEFAHVHHFNQVGPIWWSTLANQEINNNLTGNPWGDGTESNAGHVAVAESWADFLMGDVLGIGMEGWFLRAGHVPIGLYNDLIDVDNPLILENIGGTGFFDRVQSYNRVDLFSGLTPTTTDLESYREALRPLLPQGNTNENFDEVFNAYMQ